jgi:hypothetical protein
MSTMVEADLDAGLGLDVALDENGNHITGYCNVTTEGDASPVKCTSKFLLALLMLLTKTWS